MEKKIIKDFLKRYFDVEKISDDTNFIEEGLVNSLFFMQLLLFIENEFDIAISNEEIQVDNFCTVNNLLNFIGSYR